MDRLKIREKILQWCPASLLDEYDQPLSQEAVRDEALEAAVRRYLKEQGDESWWTASERRLAIALKREPNAAARARQEEVIEIDEDGKVHPEGVNLKNLRPGASDD